ncbi:MAG: hypothetical protein V4582_11850 [Pseudomonadota bacterium]
MKMDTTAKNHASAEELAAAHENRRLASRYDPGMPAAVWFSVGSDMGELCTLHDISSTGFGTLCSEAQLATFAEHDHPMYCVLLFGAAHFGCMVHPVDAQHANPSHMGFCFDAIPEHDIRLVNGLIARMAARELERAGAA